MPDDDAYRRLAESVTGRPGFTMSIGTRVLDARRGEVRMMLERRTDLLQFNGNFHGGVIAGLADHAAGGAVSTLLMQERRIAVTVDLHVNYLSAANGEALVATAQAVHMGGTIGVAQVDIACVNEGREMLCAIATATMRAVQMPT